MSLRNERPIVSVREEADDKGVLDFDPNDETQVLPAQQSDSEEGHPSRELLSDDDIDD